MADERPSARHDEQFIIDNQIARSERAEFLRRSHEVVDASDDRVRDSMHRLRICFEDVIDRDKSESR